MDPEPTLPANHLTFLQLVQTWPFWLLFALLLATLHYLKLYKRTNAVTVNCWFCNRDQEIAKNSKGFTCAFCDQYNGFGKDGDYDRVLPEQYYGSMNEARFSTLKKNTLKSMVMKNDQLCDRCNSEQWMKLRQERDFEPEVESDDEEGYELELKRFRCKLDKQYPLCMRCELILKTNELGKYNMFQNFRQRVRSGTNDFLKAVDEKNIESEGESRGTFKRVAKYLVCYSTLYFAEIPISHSVEVLVTLLQISRLIICLKNSKSYFGAALRISWILDTIALILTYFSLFDIASKEFGIFTLLTRAILGTWTLINCFAAGLSNQATVEQATQEASFSPANSPINKLEFNPNSVASSQLMTENTANSQVMTELTRQPEIMTEASHPTFVSAKARSSIFAAHTNSHFTTPPPSETGTARHRWNSAPQSPPKHMFMKSPKSPEHMEVDSDDSPQRTVIANPLLQNTPPGSQNLNYLKHQTRGSPGELVSQFDSISQINAQEPYKLRQKSPHNTTSTQIFGRTTPSRSLVSQHSELRQRKMNNPSLSPASPTKSQVTNFTRVREHISNTGATLSPTRSQSSRFTTQSMIQTENHYKFIAAMCITFAVGNAVTLFFLIKYFNN